MDPAWLTTFGQFGYPALISGVLLYIIVSKLEKLAVRVENMEKVVDKLCTQIVEYRNDIRDRFEERRRPT